MSRESCTCKQNAGSCDERQTPCLTREFGRSGGQPGGELGDSTLVLAPLPVQAGVLTTKVGDLAAEALDLGGGRGQQLGDRLELRLAGGDPGGADAGGDQRAVQVESAIGDELRP